MGDRKGIWSTNNGELVCGWLGGGNLTGALHILQLWLSVFSFPSSVAAAYFIMA